MKKILVASLLALSVNAMASGVGEYSTGYRMGQITKSSVKGLMMKSVESQMLMGSESTPLVRTKTDSEGKPYQVTINPWYFSSPDLSMMKVLEPLVGEYAVIQYKQYHLSAPNVDTDYEVVNVLPIAEPMNKTCTAQSYHDGMKSGGIRVGRIVKASTKGVLVNSYEIMMQQGNAGNQFKNMSISSDPALYECAVQFLKAGQKVKVHYSQSIVNLDLLGRNTSYDIVKIEPVKGLN